MPTSSYLEQKDRNPDRVPGTCRWVLEDDRYNQGFESGHDDLIWIFADPGCGKSVLAKSLVDNELKTPENATVCYFFFKDTEEQNTLAVALCAFYISYLPINLA